MGWKEYMVPVPGSPSHVPLQVPRDLVPGYLCGTKYVPVLVAVFVFDTSLLTDSTPECTS